MGTLYVYQHNIFKEKIEIEPLKKAMLFVSFFDEDNEDLTFEYATKNPNNHIENTIKLKKLTMTLENSITNQITYYTNELLALDRNEVILDYDRKIKKADLENQLEIWQLKQAKLIEDKSKENN